MKASTYPLVRKLIAFALLTGLALGNVSSSRGASTSTISITATVLPKTPQINYKKLHDNINSRIKYYYKKDRGVKQGKYLRVTVNLDFPESDQGMMIEEVEYMV
jgi:translation elongation factor EF-1beta